MDVHPTQVEVKKSFALTMVIIFFILEGIIKNFFCFLVSTVSTGICCRMTAKCLVKLFRNHIWCPQLCYSESTFSASLFLSFFCVCLCTTRLCCYWSSVCKFYRLNLLANSNQRLQLSPLSRNYCCTGSRR